MQNTNQPDSPPSLNPKEQAESRPETPQPNESGNQPVNPFINELQPDPPSESDVPGTSEEEEARSSAEAAAAAEAEAGADVPFTDEQEEARFIEVHGGPSGRLRTPEEASEERVTALESIRERVQIALQRFRKVTKQSHTVDRLLGSLTPTASMAERLPFTPVPSLQLLSRNRDDHILHLAGLVIVIWGVLSRSEVGGWSPDDLRASVSRLEDVIHDRRQFKVYPVDPRSSLFTLRRITDQAKLNKAAEDQESKRATRLSGDGAEDLPRRTD